VSSVKQWI